jgi:hypothetical protein
VFLTHAETDGGRFGYADMLRRYQRQSQLWRQDVKKWLAKNPDHCLRHWVELGFSVNQVVTFQYHLNRGSDSEILNI